MNKKINIQFGVLTIIVLLAAFSRLFPHMLNFSPLGAIGLFGSAHFTKRWQVFLIPILATWLSDLFINNIIYAAYNPEFIWFYQGFYWQYGSYILIALLGIFLYSNKVIAQNVLIGAVGASLIFFFISNFGVWAGSNMYPKTLVGLLNCYLAGIPFMKGTLLGNLFYASVLFGGFYFLQKRFTLLQPLHLKYAWR